LQRQDADLDRLGGSAQSPDAVAVDEALGQSAARVV
jgi:hypothetical protein